MRRLSGGLVLAAIVGLVVGLAAPAAEAGCPPDSVLSGTACIDKYEASVWLVAPAQTNLIKKIQAGKATLADLQAGGFQRGLASGDLAPECPADGADCTDVYAVSIAGVTPAAAINWFQAAAAARNSRKRLPTNAEWQAAALGTPDPGTDNGTTDCNISTAGAVVNTGSRSSCVSDVRAFDMVGNLDEWVADWVPRSTGSCGSWGSLSDDFQCLVGADTTGAPGALIRGGFFGGGTGAGVFAVGGFIAPSSAGSNLGFRAAR